MDKIYDVVVIGAGPGGTAAAYTLARSGLQVCLLDKAVFPRDKTCGDGLTPRALHMLAEIGILDNLLPLGFRANRLEMSAPGGSAFSAPFPAAQNLSGYALIVPRPILDNTLLERALDSGAAFQSPVRVTGIATHAQGVKVTGERHSRQVKVQGRAAIIATGAHTGLLFRTGLLRQMPAMALAARAYYEGVNSLSDEIQLRYEGVPLPGYGWIFPLPGSAANIGAGIFPRFRKKRPDSGTPQAAFHAFTGAPALQPLLAGARQAGPLKGHPLRIDFPDSPVFAERILLVGEAAGLVNPLTGEGIDYALESGKIAAEHLALSLSVGDLSHQAMAGYDRKLRKRFQRLFRFCNAWRDLTVNPLLLKPMVTIGARSPTLKMQVVRIVFGEGSLIVSI